MSTVVVRAVYEDDIDADVFDARRVDAFTGRIGQTRIDQSGDHIVGAEAHSPASGGSRSSPRSRTCRRG